MIQVGVSHEHALGKFTTLKSMKDTFEVIGVVNDNDFALTPRFIGADEFESYKGERFITLDQALNEEKPDGVLIESGSCPRGNDVCGKRDSHAHG